jgi:hypothetical protein
MYLKSLAIFEKSFQLIKKSLNFSEYVSKKNQNLKKSLKFSENIFKMPRFLKKSLAFSKKATLQLPQWPPLIVI